MNFVNSHNLFLYFEKKNCVDDRVKMSKNMQNGNVVYKSLSYVRDIY